MNSRESKNGKLKILYLSFNDPYATPGVYRKESEFCELMGKICSKFDIIFKGMNIFTTENNTSQKHPLVDNFDLIELGENHYKYFSRVKFLRIILRTKLLLEAAYKSVRTFRPDVIIMRYELMRLLLPFNPKRISSDILFISEHQTKETYELAMDSFYYLFMPLEELKAKILFKNVDAIIGVTSEIVEYELERAHRNIPNFVLSNGIIVDNYPMKRYLDFKGDELKIIFVASKINKWHGLDRLLKGIKDYKGNVRIKLDIVGSITQDILNLVDTLSLEEKVMFHGVKYGRELDELYDNAHIAAGSLGLHRGNIKYASTLKVREYMARGIPFIISHIDEDIEEDFPFCLKIRADDSSIQIEKVIEFARNIYESYGPRISEIMRGYALTRLDYNVKLENLLNFILKLYENTLLYGYNNV